MFRLTIGGETKYHCSGRLLFSLLHMKKSLSRSHSAFFNSRVLVSFALCIGGLALAISAFKTSSPPNRSEPSENATTEASQELRQRDMPTLGEDPGDEAKDLERLEQFWNDRLTYPTGKFNPAWLRAAAIQHKKMPAALPAGNFNKLKAAQAAQQKMAVKTTNVKGQPSKTIGPITSALSTTSFTALGPSPEQMTGCSGCFNYGITEGRVNVVAVDPTTTTNGSIVA